VRVYAAASISPYPASYCDRCDAPVDAVHSATISAADGTFSLDLDAVPSGSTIDFAIQIGRFRKHTTVSVPACATSAVSPSSATVLPGSSSAGDIPSIVVSSGNSDHLDAVLTNLGITEYDCYEGRKDPSGSTSTCQEVSGMNIADVISDATRLGTYDMAFLSCAPGAYADYITSYDQATMTANTASWVNGGGRVFVTDTAYDYIAQPFPNAIVWAGPTGTPQPVDGANVGCAPDGTGGASAHSVLYSTTVDDTDLGAWLTLLGLASGTPPTASVQGFYEPWSTMSSLASSASLIIDGTVPIDPTYPSTSCQSPTDTDVPLTAEFEVGSCGRVVFSSFHTYTGTGASSAAANEKIMEYLIFAAAACNE
jgi:hypothetical protein